MGIGLQRWRIAFTPVTAADMNGRALTGGDGGQAGKPVWPFFIYYTKPWDEHLSFGLGLNEPFGYATHYDESSVLRYHAIYSSLQIVNLNPSFAYRFNETFSLGAGLDLQRVYLKQTNALDFGAICDQRLGVAVCAAEGVTPSSHDGFTSAQLDGSGYGFNLGVLWNVTDATRLGVSYRSRVKHTLDGNASFAGVPHLLASQSQFQDQGASSALTTPQILSLSVVHRFSPAWSLDADWSYTGWGSIDRTDLHLADPGTQDLVLRAGLAYSYRYSVGLDYHASEAWAWRAGIAVDNSPVPDAKYAGNLPINEQTNDVKASRTARLPDDDRRWLAVGVSWQESLHSRWDLGYARLMMNSHIPFDQTDAISLDKITGQFNEHMDILALAYLYLF